MHTHRCKPAFRTSRKCTNLTASRGIRICNGTVALPPRGHLRHLQRRQGHWPTRLGNSAWRGAAEGLWKERALRLLRIIRLLRLSPVAWQPGLVGGILTCSSQRSGGRLHAS
ncbi:hypothetical protein N9L68_02015 [bacterium]|nr:hypothetical protein [bacterium]